VDPVGETGEKRVEGRYKRRKAVMVMMVIIFRRPTRPI